MPAFNPLDARMAKAISKRSFEVERLPIPHWIEMLDERRQQSYSKPLDGAARLVASLVLVEPQIGIPRGLSHIQAPPPHSGRVMQQDDVYRMVGAPLTRRRSAEGPSDPSSFAHPVGADRGHRIA